jgi:predicted permease
VGFPLLEILFGSHALSTGILVDQGGSFLVASTLGILAAQFYAEKKFSIRHCVRRVLNFPPFLAVLASIPLHFVTFDSGVEHVLDRLALTLLPLALFSVGLQLDVSRRAFIQRRAALLTGLGLKLIVSPLVFLFLYGKSGVLDGEVLRIVLTESAMAPMITAGVIAVEQGLDAETANMMLGLGIPLSFVSVVIWKSIFDLLV